MKKLLILTLLVLLIGCETIPVNFNIENDSHQAFAFNIAVSFLEAKGYPIADNVEKPLIAIHSTPKLMKETLGLSKEFLGWYCPDTGTINLTVGCGQDVIIHEFKHYLLHSLGIPPKLHHEIMGKK